MFPCFRDKSSKQQRRTTRGQRRSCKVNISDVSQLTFFCAKTVVRGYPVLLFSVRPGAECGAVKERPPDAEREESVRRERADKGTLTLVVNGLK